MVKLPSLKLVGILSVFLVIGILMMVWSVSSMVELGQVISQQAEEITFDKGAYYLFGGGLFFLVLSLGSFISFFIRDELAAIYARSIGIFMLVSLVLVFLLPGVVHRHVDQTMEQGGYSICMAKSSQWLFVKTVVYSKKSPCL